MEIKINIPDRIANFFLKLIRIKHSFFGFFLSFCLGSALVYAVDPMQIAHTFSSGKLISAEEMNENFLAVKAKVDELAYAVQGVPVGTIVPFAGDIAQVPTGWLLCDGSQVSRTGTTAALWMVLGIKWGAGDAVTTFNLPDFRGRFLRGVDNGAGNDPDTVSRYRLFTSGNIQDNVGSYQDDAFQGHWHDVYDNAFPQTVGMVGNVATGGSTIAPVSNNGGRLDARLIKTDTVNGTPRITGETRVKNANVNYIIKY